MVFNPFAGVPADGVINSPDFVYTNDYSVGNVETRVMEWEFLKEKDLKLKLKKIRVWLRLKSSDGVATATAKLYINNSAGFDPNSDQYISGTPDATVSTTSGTYVSQLMELKGPIKALPDGLHTLTLSLVSGTAGQTADSNFQKFAPHNDD